MLAGRSSAAFLADPSWESLALVRLAPSDGPSMANSAHHRLDEVVRTGGAEIDVLVVDCAAARFHTVKLRAK